MKSESQPAGPSFQKALAAGLETRVPSFAPARTDPLAV
jgi:hypothetical protein